MSVKQISVSLENVPGRFLAVSECLGREGINIRAISVADTSDISTVRFVTDNPEKTANVLRSKGYRKVARDIPLERMMLETDAPWLGVRKEGESWVLDQAIRNEPTTIRITAEKVAEIKKIPFDEVWKACGDNSARFFALKL